MRKIIIRNSPVIDGKKPSYIELMRYVEVQDEHIKELEADNLKLRDHIHNLIHKLLRLFAAKHPDICEYFTDCDFHNGACVNEDSELRKRCNMYISYETNNRKALNGKR